jgi:hypothetical protein
MAVGSSLTSATRSPVFIALLRIAPPPDTHRIFLPWQAFRLISGGRTELRRGDFDDPIGAVLTLQDSFDNQVDLLVGIRGFDPEAFSRSIEVSLYGEALKFVSLEDFIAMKLFAGGPKDIEDAKSAIESALEPLDLDLVRKLASRYGADTVHSLENLQGDLVREKDSGLELD